MEADQQGQGEVDTVSKASSAFWLSTADNIFNTPKTIFLKMLSRVDMSENSVLVWTEKKKGAVCQYFFKKLN